MKGAEAPSVPLRQAWASRPMASAALGLALGLLVGRRVAVPAPLAWIAAAAAFGWLLRELRREDPRRLGTWLFVAGLAAGLGRVQPLRQALAAPGRPVEPGLRLQARLLSDEGERLQDRRHIFIAQALAYEALRPEGTVPPLGRLRLSADLMAARDWLPGDRVELYGTWRQPPPPSNPGEFDYRAFLLGRGIQGSFSARPGWPAWRTQAAGAWQVARAVALARRWLTRGLASGLDGRALVLARGIVLGDKAGFNREDNSLYARSGFADILAVSGAHFTLALGLVLLLARLFTHSRRRQALAGLLFGLAYALVTGFEAPVQRAFALFAVWLIARALEWECEALTSLAAGALAILLVQPGALWEAGFELSFACTLTILLVAPRLAKALPARWPAVLSFTLGALAAAQLALAPLLAYHFHQLCWPGLLACLVSGLFTAGILGLGLPLALLGSWLPGSALLLGWPLEKLLLLLDACAGRMAHWPGAAYSTGLIPAWVLLLPILWGLALLSYQGPRRRSLLGAGGLGLLALLLWQGLPWMHRHPGETRLWMLNVGQGDGLLLEFEDGRCLLVDAGAAQPDAGAWVVVPALRALGIQRLAWALGTHPDADHIGGLAWVLDQVPVGVLLTNGLNAKTQAWQAVLASAERRGVPLRTLRTDLPREADDGPWQVLNPSPKRPRKTKRKRKHPPKANNNDESVVLRVEDWLLLTGDLPKSGEKRLLKRGLGPVEVLKAGHHGSKSSSGPAFVQALRPSEALLSCGAWNRYGHPTREALASLRDCRLWRTDLQGCVYLRKRQGQPVQIQAWRPAEEAGLRRPHGAYHSPWRGLDAQKRRAWALFQASPGSEPETDEDPEDGDAS